MRARRIASAVRARRVRLGVRFPDLHRRCPVDSHGTMAATRENAILLSALAAASVVGQRRRDVDSRSGGRRSMGQTANEVHGTLQ